MKKEWDTILADFESYVSRCITDNAGSQKSYVSYVKSLEYAFSTYIIVAFVSAAVLAAILFLIIIR